MFLERKKWTNRYILGIGISAVLALMVWEAPEYANENKTLSRPSGMVYKHQSPDFETVVTYELVAGFYAAGM